MEIGIKGISYSATERKYLVRTRKNSKTVYIGRYSSLEEAKEALASYSDTPVKEPSVTPILESLRATFAPKSAKTSKPSKPSKEKSSETLKITKKDVKKAPQTLNTSKAAVKTARIVAPQTVNATNNEEIESMTHAAVENNLHLILRYLIKEADKRGTSVFDVVVQEVAKLSK